MSNLLFSLNIVMPIFFLIMTGVFLRRVGVLKEEFCRQANTLVFYVALPATLFMDVAQSDIKAVFDIRFILYAAAMSFIIFFLAWFLAVLLLRDKAKISAAVHGAFRGNFAFIGLPVIRSMMQSDTITSGIMVIAFIVPLYNVLATFILALYDPEDSHVSPRGMLLKMLKNPLIISILAGIPFSLIPIPIPKMCADTLDFIGQLSMPLALLMIGANLRMESFRSEAKGILLSSAVKILVSPVAGTLGALLLGFRGEQLVTLFVLFSVPSAANTYIMTKQMHGDAEMSAGIVMVTSLFCTVTMAAGIFLLKTFGALS